MKKITMLFGLLVLPMIVTLNAPSAHAEFKCTKNGCGGKTTREINKGERQELKGIIEGRPGEVLKGEENILRGEERRFIPAPVIVPVLPVCDLRITKHGNLKDKCFGSLEQSSDSAAKRLASEPSLERSAAAASSSSAL